MSTPRRRIVRPTPAVMSDPQRQQQIHKLRERLEVERTALARWQTRLRRAFNSAERIQKRVARIEREISNLEA